ncbi:permease [Blastococcus deserti]|uniref:Permease n=1 Tax=Blastococcus deserti TaxID=2259033 RepID=A0ABW4XE60_9ACTN
MNHTEGAGGALGRAAGGRGPLVAGVAVIALALALLTWAKYQPYLHKVPAVLGADSLGTSIVTGEGETAPEPSLAAGWQFTVAYLQAVWKALVTGLLLAAVVQVLLPAQWLRRAFGTSAGVGSGVRGGLWSIPTLMCSCCAAPLAVGLRRLRASLPATVAFWLGNPALNPVVLVFCLAVLPWPWAVLRFAGGLAVVAGGIAVAGWAERRAAAPGLPDVVMQDPDDVADGSLPVRFARTLTGLSVRLLPEFALVVFLLGTFRAVLFPLGGEVPGGLALVLALLVAGLLLPVPTGAEIAVVAAALAAGAPPAAAAVLLITLPVLSLPSVLMVRSVLPRRVLAGTIGVTAAVGLLGAALVPALV